MTPVNPLPWIQQEVDPRKYLGPAREAMTARLRERIQFFGANGKAA